MKRIRKIIYLLLIISLFSFSFYIIKAKNFNNLSKIIGSVAEYEKSEILKSLNTNNSDDEFLMKNGYNKSIFGDKDYYISIFVILVIFLICNLNENKEQNRENENFAKDITDYIDKLSLGNRNLKIKNHDFSIVYDKIYKVYTELWKTRENAKMEKDNYQKNLDNIAHQIKTPVTNMMLNLQVDNNKEELEYLLNRLNILTDELLKLSSFDSGNIIMKKDYFNPFEAIEEVYYELEEEFINKNISVEINLQDIKIIGDYYWITEAFLNVIKNDLNYLKPGNKIKISSIDTPIYTNILIEDNGEGIDNEDLRHIFERFYKGKNSKGFGLGLNISKSIAQKNNGDIIAYNENGAVFKFIFYK